MTKKVFGDTTNVEEKTMVALPAVKQMVRWIGASTEGSVDAVQAVDAELSEWIAQGYKLFATHYVGTDNQAFGVLYILVLDV